MQPSTTYPHFRQNKNCLLWPLQKSLIRGATKGFSQPKVKNVEFKVILCVRNSDQSNVSIHLINSVLGRERRAKSLLHPSDIISSSPGLFLNLRSKNGRSCMRFQLQSTIWFKTLETETSYSLLGDLRPHQDSAKRDAQFLASMKTYLYRRKTSACLNLSSQFGLCTSTQDYMSQVETSEIQMIRLFQEPFFFLPKLNTFNHCNKKSWGGRQG